MAEITPLSKDAFVTMAMCEECKKPFGITVDKRKFVDNENLTTLGNHKVRVELYKGVIATVKVNIQAQ